MIRRPIFVSLADAGGPPVCAEPSDETLRRVQHGVSTALQTPISVLAGHGRTPSIFGSGPWLLIADAFSCYTCYSCLLSPTSKPSARESGRKWSATQPSF